MESDWFPSGFQNDQRKHSDYWLRSYMVLSLNCPAAIIWTVNATMPSYCFSSNRSHQLSTEWAEHIYYRFRERPLQLGKIANCVAGYSSSFYHAFNGQELIFENEAFSDGGLLSASPQFTMITKNLSNEKRICILVFRQKRPYLSTPDHVFEFDNLKSLVTSLTEHIDNLIKLLS
jgi:hypothetical protein